jgi:hypothetical protein
MLGLIPLIPSIANPQFFPEVPAPAMFTSNS